VVGANRILGRTGVVQERQSSSVVNT